MRIRAGNAAKRMLLAGGVIDRHGFAERKKRETAINGV